MPATPLGSMLACVAVKDGEEALAADTVKVGDKRMRILHRPADTLVLADANLEGCILGCMPVEYAVRVDVDSRYRLGACIGRIREPHRTAKGEI